MDAIEREGGVMRFIKTTTAVEWMIIFVIGALLTAIVIGGINKVQNGDSSARNEYTAWCLLERRSDVTFEQWKTLRDAGFLTHPAK
jgi:hypothetical protein